ncbi:MAG: hypothetical protein E6Q99_03985 [Elusimicrobia bacterium]|nr:MAG: hypothetical protein E6Q99_03985 [Elusimicrobiota bacterium]
MQALTLSAAHGWRWLAEGFRLFRRNHVMLTFLIVSYWLLMGIVNMIPVAGTIVSTLCIPAFSVSLMNACRNIENGRPVTPQLLFSGFHQHLRPLLTLGGVYLVAITLILFVSSLADGGALLRLLLLADKPEAELLAGGDLLSAAQIALALLCPVMMAYWYAPVLCGWHGFSAGKALFFSFFACARNWRAFLTYSLALLLVALLLPMVVIGVLAAVLPESAGLATSLAMILIILVLAPTVFASFYVSYREVFVTGGSDA